MFHSNQCFEGVERTNRIVLSGQVIRRKCILPRRRSLIVVRHAFLPLRMSAWEAKERETALEYWTKGKRLHVRQRTTHDQQMCTPCANI